MHIWELSAQGGSSAPRARDSRLQVNKIPSSLGIAIHRNIGLTLLKLKRSAEVAHQIRNLGAKVILTHPTLVKTALAAVQESGVARCQIFQFSEHENKPVLGVEDWRSMAGSALEAEAFTFQPMSEGEAASTVATVNYSSGTTGLPKGVCVSHANLIANAEQSIFMRFSCLGEQYASEQKKSQRWVGLLPLYHAYGQLYAIVIAAKIRIPIYIMAHFHFEKFLAVIQNHSITSLQVAPPILVMLNKRPESKNYDLSSVRDILCGGAPLSKELQNESSQRLKVQIYQGWGMTETVVSGQPYSGHPGVVAKPRLYYRPALPTCQWATTIRE